MTTYVIPGIPTVGIDTIKPYWRNPRDITQASVDKMVNTIREYGYLLPILIDGEGVIITGHRRFAALRQMGATEVSVLVAANMDPAKVREFRVVENKTGEEVAWDLDTLVLELRTFDDRVLTDYFPTVDLEVGSVLKDLNDEVTQEHVDRASAAVTDVGSSQQVVLRSVTCPSCYHQFEVRQDT